MNDVRRDVPAHRDALVQDINLLVADAQALLRDVADGAGSGAATARGQAIKNLSDLQNRIAVLRVRGKKRVAQFATATDQYVHTHPWQSMGAIGALCAAASAVAVISAMRR